LLFEVTDLLVSPLVPPPVADAGEKLTEDSSDDIIGHSDPASDGLQVGKFPVLVIVEIQQAAVAEILIIGEVRRRAPVVADVKGEVIHALKILHIAAAI
jgi:hypothetical protein